MSELGQKVKAAKERLKAFEPRSGEGYYLAFSGGKDSVVVKALMDDAGVKYDAHYRVTSVDPPELVAFIRDQHPDVHRDVPRYSMDERDKKLAGKPITMWNLIPKKLMPPTRIVRYCCEKLKEDSGDGRLTVTGVRWAESANRKNNQGMVVIQGDFRDDSLDGQLSFFEPIEGREVNERHGSLFLTNDNAENRRLVEHCFRRHKTTVNPIIDWTDEDVWDFIRAENIPYCGLYDEGFKRLGCIGCPMAQQSGREIEFARWPKYKENYLRAFARMLEARKAKGKADLKALGTNEAATPEIVYQWWMEYGVKLEKIEKGV